MLPFQPGTLGSLPMSPTADILEQAWQGAANDQVLIPFNPLLLSFFPKILLLSLFFLSAYFLLFFVQHIRHALQSNP